MAPLEVKRFQLQSKVYKDYKIIIWAPQGNLDIYKEQMCKIRYKVKVNK